MKVEDQSTDEKRMGMEDTFLSQQKSKFEYQSQPISHRHNSIDSRFSNKILHEKFEPIKPFQKEIDEEESVREMHEYCRDDSTFKQQPE
jgi:hypothetical protein